MKNQMIGNQAICSYCRKRRQNVVILLATIMLGAFFSNEVNASQITMSDPEEQELAGDKRLCVYSNSLYTFTTVTRSQNCPYSKTFDTEDAE